MWLGLKVMNAIVISNVGICIPGKPGFSSAWWRCKKPAQSWPWLAGTWPVPLGKRSSGAWFRPGCSRDEPRIVQDPETEN